MRCEPSRRGNSVRRLVENCPKFLKRHGPAEKNGRRHHGDECGANSKLRGVHRARPEPFVCKVVRRIEGQRQGYQFRDEQQRKPTPEKWTIDISAGPASKPGPSSIN